MDATTAKRSVMSRQNQLMNYYCCKKCATTITKDSTPSTSGCPSGGSHNWSKLCAVGTKHNYQCKKCSVLVKSDSTPSTSGCPDSSSHNWNKL